MGSIYSSGIDDMIEELERLEEDVGQALDDMMDAALAEVEYSWRQSAQNHGFEPPGKSGKGTGSMIDSIGHTPIRKGRNGRYSEVLSGGKDEKGYPNDVKAFYQHAGTENIYPTYWVEEAEAMARPAVERHQEMVWEQYINKS